MKYFSILSIFMWLVAIGLQSFGIIKFGSVVVSKPWFFYVLVGFVSLFVSDYYGLLNSKHSPYIFIAFLIYIVGFNLVYAFDLYKISPLVNRLEHFLGSMLVSFIVYSFLTTLKIYSGLPNHFIKSALLFCFVATFGVVNEIVELFLDFVFKTKNIGPELFDTNLDLLMNSLGTVVFIFIVKVFGLL